MSAHEHRFGYCTNAKTCFNVHFGAILAERRVLLGARRNESRCGSNEMHDSNLRISYFVSTEFHLNGPDQPESFVILVCVRMICISVL